MQREEVAMKWVRITSVENADTPCPFALLEAGGLYVVLIVDTRELMEGHELLHCATHQNTWYISRTQFIAIMQMIVTALSPSIHLSSRNS